MPKAKEPPPGRDLVLRKLAAKQNMTVPEWTAHLQNQEIERMKKEDPTNYRLFLKDVLDELLDIPQDHRSANLTTNVSRNLRITVSPTPFGYIYCPSCDETKFIDQFTRGFDACNSCRLE